VYDTFARMQAEENKEKEKKNQNQVVEIIKSAQSKADRIKTKEVNEAKEIKELEKVKEPIDFETYLKQKKEKKLTKISSNPNTNTDTKLVTKDIFDSSDIPIININEEFDDDDTDYSDAKKSCGNEKSEKNGGGNESSLTPVEVGEAEVVSHIIEEEVDDVRYIPPPRIIGQSGDGNSKLIFELGLVLSGLGGP
jgi:hypothetical protein